MGGKGNNELDWRDWTSEPCQISAFARDCRPVDFQMDCPKAKENLRSGKAPEHHDDNQSTFHEDTWNVLACPSSHHSNWNPGERLVVSFRLH